MFACSAVHNTHAWLLTEEQLAACMVGGTYVLAKVTALFQHTWHLFVHGVSSSPFGRATGTASEVPS